MTIVEVPLWDSTAKIFHRIAIPEAYIIHIWWIQMQAKFWRDTATTESDNRMAIYLSWLIDTFAKEALKDNERQLIAPGWQSQVLDGILCRTFFHIIEQDVTTDFVIALRSARTANNDNYMELDGLQPTDLSQVYKRWDVMIDDCREGANFSYLSIWGCSSLRLW